MKESKTITTKSSYETRYALLFEDTCIPWNYEPFIIRDGECLYLPDFVFTYNGVDYMLEVKGFFANEDRKQEYFETKIKAAKKWCEENNHIFLFTFNGNPKSIEEIIEENNNNVEY